MSKALVVAEKTHAALGASKASIWWACPGSIRMQAGLDDPDSFYKREGTAAHALAELALRKQTYPAVFVGTTLEGVEVTDDMAEFVSVFVDYCRALPTNRYWIEHQFNLAHLNPPGPMFGTADFVVFNDALHELEVVDFKYGQGVLVDVYENKQLRYYALGAALSFPELHIESVKITIVQPRATHRDGVIRSETLTFSELIDFAGELLAAARATTDPKAPLHAGTHCRWCLASGACPEQLRAAQETAMVEFSAVPLDVPPDPTLVPIQTLAEWNGKFHILEAWMASVRGRLQSTLERGEDVPGYKLVARRANRSWVQPAETIQWLQSKGLTADDYMDQKLKSPAGVERLVGKKGLPETLTQKVSSGYTMVPETDARPAVQLHPGDEFDVLTAGQGEDA